MENSMNILIVGAGSVGQVYGRHLLKAGARVSFFVREKYADSLKKGYSVYPLNETREKLPARVTGFHVITQLTDVEAQSWNQVYLCIPSTGLKGDWLAPFMRAIRDATVISILPGLDDRNAILAHLPENQLVSGTVSFASYNAPLPGEAYTEKGMAYWFFPMAPNQYSSNDRKRVNEVVSLLRKGRIPAKAVRDITRYLTFSIASTEVLIIALEMGGWTFRGLNRELLREACRGTHEAMKVAAKRLGVRAPVFRFLIQPLTIRFATTLLPKLMPLPFEAMLKAHYTKVRSQTHQELNAYIDAGEKLGVSVERMKKLREKIQLRS